MTITERDARERAICHLARAKALTECCDEALETLPMDSWDETRNLLMDLRGDLDHLADIIAEPFSIAEVLRGIEETQQQTGEGREPILRAMIDARARSTRGRSGMNDPLTIYECPECGHAWLAVYVAGPGDHPHAARCPRHGSYSIAPDAVPIRVFREDDDDAVIASARVLRVIADPAMQTGGCDPWLIGTTLDDYPREHVERIMRLLIKEGSVVERDGRLFSVEYEPEDEPRA